MNPDQPNGVTGRMMESGVEAFLRGSYVGVAIDVGGTAPKVLDSASAIGCALARAIPAMLDKAEGSSRDTLLHPGAIGGADLAAWDAMSPLNRAQHVTDEAPRHLLGLAAMLARQRMGNPGFDARTAFLADALVALARQMERAVVIQRRDRERRQAAALLATERDRDARRAARAKPKRKRRAAKAKGMAPQGSVATAAVPR